MGVAMQFDAARCPMRLPTRHAQVSGQLPYRHAQRDGRAERLVVARRILAVISARRQGPYRTNAKKPRHCDTTILARLDQQR